MLKHGYMYTCSSNYYSRIKNTTILGGTGEIRFRGWLGPVPPKGFQQTKTQRFVFLKAVLVKSISFAYVHHSPLTPWECLCHPTKTCAFNEIRSLYLCAILAWSCHLDFSSLFGVFQEVVLQISNSVVFLSNPLCRQVMQEKNTGKMCFLSNTAFAISPVILRVFLSFAEPDERNDIAWE